MKRLILSAVIFISACGTTAVPVVVELQLPPPLIVPKLNEEQSLECLTDDAYNVLERRDKLKSARIETLENIIKSTHAK